MNNLYSDADVILSALRAGEGRENTEALLSQLKKKLEGMKTSDPKSYTLLLKRLAFDLKDMNTILAHTQSEIRAVRGDIG
ncbi:MAG: hypothetical protein UY44_C0002G0039 [Candidatus Kaiserbacteria bacterium GW2011_GWA2_49_19]|uniref:Uncharacterized protein n=2 Tax=Candidatus Kaiseribacteriota TaxID=1752734 RepID=A0A0G1YSP1_9BACT|nr:MAG: hypothetical protein UY44_C0002G0039 [Candidatus Kaiserbacteria bacterium GW2011_GWA2_49_19]OGG60497.1 MAG: hypothetical protein A3C86_01065 [Candidatus Kaiserbacteria bacterium RIFCSPHIGHO2_02_FULL_49_16]